ncbi:ferritin [bacterium]|nr:ferritin [bacterium]
MEKQGNIISASMNDAINKQIGREFAASLQYISMATYFDGEGLTQLSAFFYRQADEERDHAMRFVKYLVDAGGQVAIPPIAGPQNEFETIKAAISLALEWEREVTRDINDMMKMAVEESDFISQNQLSWFINEQLEELATMDNLLKVIQHAGDNVLYIEDYVASHGVNRGESASNANAGN